MKNKKRYSIKNILLTILWISIGAGIGVLLVAAMRKKDAQLCKSIDITITAANNNIFVDKKDIADAITIIANGNPVGKTIGALNLRMMETQLKKNIWVNNADIFIDNNGVMVVNINERVPVARVFNTLGSSFYIDDAIAVLPLSEKCSPLLPVFTNFPVGEQQLLKADSNLLMDIKTISLAIQKDTFMMAMIDQVDITPQRNFEMVPKIGNQVIVFGDASATTEKLAKLKIFYQQVMVKAGWNNYSVINVQYKNQVVAKRRGAEDVTADSLRTLQLMQMIVNNAEKQAEDSLQNQVQGNDNTAPDSSMIQQSIQRDEHTETSNTIENPIATIQPKVPPVLNSNQPAKNKPAKNPISIQNQKPVVPKKPAPQTKTVKPKKNDYAPIP